MASRLATIFGTEQDRVNCSFYYKVSSHCSFVDSTLGSRFPQIGACRHGDRCSRKHIRPPFSQTILLPNVYHNPAHDPNNKLTDGDLQGNFDAVYEDLYWYVDSSPRYRCRLTVPILSELAKYGHLLELHVCDNVGDHLIGNVYARYEWEAEAQKAVEALNERWYAGMYPSPPPVNATTYECPRSSPLRRTLPRYRFP